MQVKLVRSGGLAGLNLVATVDTGDLPTDQQEVVSRLLTEDLRVGVPAGSGPPGGADQFTYQLEIRRDGRTVRRRWKEPEVHDVVRPLLSALSRQAKPAR